MNQAFLDFLKPKILRFVENATETDCALVLGKIYNKGFYEFICSLRNRQKGEQINFICQFPDQATILPCYAFILGNNNSPLQMQSFNYEDSELKNLDAEKYLHLCRSIEGNAIETFHYKAWMSTTSIIISTYSTNKDSASWLMTLADFIIKMSAEELEVNGFLNLSTKQTDLRIQQELFPLKVPTRVMTIDFTYQQAVPMKDLIERHKFEGETKFNYK